MKTIVFQLFFLTILSPIAFGQQLKPNSLAIAFSGDNNLLGISYHRNMNAWWGLCATLRVDAYATAASYDDNLETSFPKGKYILSSDLDIVPSIATVEPDYMVPTGDLNGIEIMSNSFLWGGGLFVEKRGLLFKKLNAKLSSYLGTIRENRIEYQTAYGVNQSIGPKGENPFQFNYYHHHHEIYWTKPYLLLELQLDYSVYKALFVGLNLDFMPISNNTMIAQYFGSFTIGTRF